MSKRLKAGAGIGNGSAPAAVAPGSPVAKRPKQTAAAGGARIAPNGYRLPDPLPAGEVLTDNTKNQWIMGQSIGCGGFGEIYAAKPVNERTDHWNYVVKIDHQNGPLYAEMYFYHRVAKEESIRNWMREKRLDFLGMPRYIASGIHERQSKQVKGKSSGSSSSTTTTGTSKYRFLVMQRFGDDLQKKLQQVSHQFDLKTTYTICKKVIDILEYIHSFGYIHADIKASNLLLGRSYAPTPKGKGLAEQNGVHSEVWLVDFGLVEKYRNSEGQHRTCEEDQRRANNGTVEFTSRDSHIGALCRRSDLEILGFNMLSWLSGGRLPWMAHLKDHKVVHSMKKYFMDRLHELFNYAFDKTRILDGSIDYDTPASSEKSGKNIGPFDKSKLTAKVPAGIIEYFQYIVKLDFMQDPDYDLLKAILSQAISKSCKGQGVDDDGRFYFTKIPAKTVAKITSRMKRSSLSSPEMGRRRTRQSDEHEDDDVEAIGSSSESESEDETLKKKTAAGRRKAVAAAGRKQPASRNGSTNRHETPVRGRNDQRAKNNNNNVRSKSVSPVKSPCLSAPTSHVTPQKSTPESLLSAGLDKPTPAMLAVLQRLKEKRKNPKGKTLFPAAIAGVDALTTAVTSNAVKRGRPPKSSTSSVTSTAATAAASTKSNGHDVVEKKDSDDQSPVRKRGKSVTKARVVVALSAPSVVSGDRKLSSNSSTHSTKENKSNAGRTQPTRRSPRVHV